MCKWRINNSTAPQYIYSNSDLFESWKPKPRDDFRNLWDKFSDQILFNLKAVAMNFFTLKVVKRNVISVFLVSLTQKTSATVYHWHENNFTKDLCNENWLRWTISKISFHILNITYDPIVLHKIHVFSDTVLEGYCSCVYLKTIGKIIREALGILLDPGGSQKGPIR